jgi:type II secretion system protein N
VGLHPEDEIIALRPGLPPVIRSVLLHLALLGLAFLLALALLLPYNLLADRLVFDRIREETGVEISARRILPGWPGTMHAENVLARTRWKNEVIEMAIPSASARIDLLSLLGTRTGGLELDLAGGRVAIRLESSRTILRADRIELARFEPLGRITGWRLAGEAEMTATIAREGAISAMNGDLRVKARNVEAGGVNFLGLDLAPIRLASFDAEIALENGRATIRKAAASGGNLDFTAEGGATLAAPLKNSALDLLVRFRPGAPIEAAVGASALKLMIRPDGAIHLGLAGTLEKPALGFR